MKNRDDNRLVTLKMLKTAFDDFGRNFGREMRDFMRQEISASETRIKQEILEGVAEIIDHGIHPQLDDHEKRILKLETKAQH
jgi:hypothetical protein